MANLKEIKNRINSVGSTMKITSAMKMVSAAKLKKAQDAITAMRPYAQKLSELLNGLSTSMDGEIGGDYTALRPINKVLLVVVTSNRGLCGAFNSNVIKATQQRIQSTYKGKEVAILSIGKKGGDSLKKRFSIIEDQSTLFDDLTFDNAAQIAQNIMDKFVSGEFDKIELIYNHFKNAASQTVLTEDFLPLKASSESDNTSVNLDYLFEPSKEEIILDLIPKSLKMQLYKAVRDSFASEHGARMTAMHKATDNASDLKNQLTLSYNKARQAAITGEILEIVGGAEALNG